MFGRGFKIFTLFGIPVYLDWSFFVVVPLFAWLLGGNLLQYAQIVGLEQQTTETFGVGEDGAVERPGLALAFGAAVTLGLYLSVLVHEFGHALTARLFGVNTDRVTLWFLGGIASFERMPRQPGAEAIVAIVGPLTSLAVAGLLWMLSSLSDGDAYAWQFVVQTLSVINLVLAVFNLLPALPLDGGRVLRSLLALFMPYVRATAAAAGVSKVLAVLLGLSAFFTGNLLFIVFAFFIWTAVNAETRQSVVETLLKGVRVGDLMVREVETVPPTLPAAGLYDEMIRRRHLGFPVVDDAGRVLGVVGLRDLSEGVPPGATVAEVMNGEMCLMPASAPAQLAFEEMGRRGFSRCVVVDESGRLIGLLTKSDLMRLIQIRSAASAAASLNYGHEHPQPLRRPAAQPTPA